MRRSFEVLVFLKRHSVNQMASAKAEKSRPVCFVRHNMITDISKSTAEDVKSVRDRLNNAVTKKIERSWSTDNV